MAGMSNRRKEVMLTLERVGDLFGIEQAELRSYIKYGNGPKAVSTTNGVLYPLATCHDWFRRTYLPSDLRKRVKAVEAIEAESEALLVAQSQT